MNDLRKLAISSLLLAFAITASAQLKVVGTGTVYAGDNLTYSSYNLGLGSYKTGTTGYHIGMYGRANQTGSGVGFSCGVYGQATNSFTGMNFGVAGVITSSTKGAGIMGADQGVIGYNLTAKYAGYFLGNTYVSGTLTANQVIQSSDFRLKDNIVSLSTCEESTLNKLLDMNVVEYNYKPMIPSLEVPDSVAIEDVVKTAGLDTEKKHIGLIAQELKELYPNLVVEGQDGYLGINYVEIVPLLIRSIQELNEKVNALEKNAEDGAMSRSVNGVDNITAKGTVLYQNTPNPFTERTTIRFSLPEDAQNAYIYIFDMTGKMQKQLPIDASMQSITINGYELSAGMYIYSLVVNGKEMDTKRMILSK